MPRPFHLESTGRPLGHPYKTDSEYSLRFEWLKLIEIC